MAPPFFIVGNDRSGTTMLRLIVDRSEVAVPPESMFLADFAPVRRAGGLGDPERAARFARRVWEHPRVRAWGLSGAPPEMPAGLSHGEAYRFAASAPFEASKTWPASDDICVTAIRQHSGVNRPCG